ncbi:Transcriptional regulatory protein SIN3 [Fusarium oxysporum]|uniref:Transcriptional regulatory protein SIN3 n=1 Tax=Fusarium oxysporum TaxID=5507 RepID=A0A420RD73_FUSOX|nr:Transcriptional regulatory protein SIN3 [Fusarium oxysporum]
MSSKAMSFFLLGVTFLTVFATEAHCFSWRPRPVDVGHQVTLQHPQRSSDNSALLNKQSEKRLSNVYNTALQELQDLESEPLCHRIAARLLVNNCHLLDGQDDAKVHIDSGRAARDFVDSYAASLAICDLERGSFRIPVSCSKFRESTLATLSASPIPQIHVSTVEIDECLEGLAQSDSAWNTWVSYRHKALRFCDAARADHQKDENILLYQKITKILEKLTRDIEADMEERFHSLNRAYTAASQSVEDIGPHVRHLRTEMERASQILRDDLGRAAQVPAPILEYSVDQLKGMGKLEKLAEDLLVKYDNHESRLDKAFRKTGQVLDILDATAASATGLQSYVFSSFGLSGVWPYIICPFLSLAMGSYGLQPSLSSTGAGISSPGNRMNSQNLGPVVYDRDREMEERHRALQQREEMARRDQEREREQRERERDRDRESNDRYQSTPHHSSAGSIPIHQPVASRISGAIHSPGGLLANHNGNPQIPLGNPPGPPLAAFGGPLQSEHNRPVQHGGPNNSNTQPQMFAPMPHGGPPTSTQAAANSVAAVFGGPLQQQPPEGQRGGQQSAPFNPAAASAAHQLPGGITQGQQPILNDALTYLDQVKVQFHDQPDVYNRFLDIMKDFKSQAIDTPGVINRVSELFAGHPNLIQGFNTFLPPGYRIECGAGNDPNTIRVTTPMGTTVQSITGRGNQGDGHGPATANQPLFPERGSQWQQQRPQHSIESPEAQFSTPVQNGASLFVQAAAHNAAFNESNNSGQRRALPQGSTGPGEGPNARQALTPTPSGQAGVNGNAANQANMERRGPVEFNHAISYVNKIKNRFQDKPEIYKQFLEILQTYQREQKPIQDVYAQVTTLFNSAPDLLEDFKQFLPESAGQAKQTPNRMDDGPPSGPNQTPQPAMRDGQKMPPLGSFAPPASATKDNKKRPRADKQATQPATVLADATLITRTLPPIANGHKRPKLNHARPGGDNSAVEPTLTPVMPEPYPAKPSSTSSQEEIAFFERVKKFLSNRSSMNEFLKLCNLFSQNIIDRNTLFHKGALFIGANPDLMNFWKTFVGVDTQDVIIDNRPAPPTEKVSLSNCRGYGPSYRLLPKRERLKPCSGRDELCNSVLNDEWASHPTWASEDSGFVAHRKNQFEEGLHRIEEERHDYDFNIEANIKCIQLLEPIAQNMLAMSAAERETFQMPVALAGQSTSIFKRICKKIYGDRGIDVVNDMFTHPFDVVPVLLARMKQKDEEWRFSQREWEKVWHAQTENMHLKSLDHMGILVKQNDKRHLTAKHLVDVIKTKHEEQRRERSLKGDVPRHQFSWDFSDKDTIIDLLRLMMLYSLHNGQHSSQEKERILEFFESFIPAFFDIPEENIQDKLPKMQPDSGEDEVEDHTPAELTNGRSRRNGRKGDLLRGVLDPGRNGSKPRGHKEDSASGSKETTPDVTSANEEEMPDASDDVANTDVSNERWIPNIPKPVVVGQSEEILSTEGELKADGFFTRPWYNFFCNQTLFVFFSIFQTLYRRLQDLKEAKEVVAKEVERLNKQKPARDIGFTENHMKFFDTNDDPDSYWPKTLELIEEYITGDVDESRYQDVMRHYYLKTGWKVYTIQDLLKTLCRLALTCSSTDVKEKTPDLIAQYQANREREETSYQTEISARKFAEKCVKDGDIFVICWFPSKSEATVRWLQREETTFYMDEMQLRERWQYYISSFIRVEPTEGVPRSKLQKVVLSRNLPSPDADSDEDSIPKAVSYKENLTISICLKSSKMIWAPGTSEYVVYDQGPKSAEQRERRDKFIRALSAHRENKLLEKWVHNPAWTKDLSPEEVQEQNKNFRKWMDDGVVPPSAAEDVEMD